MATMQRPLFLYKAPKQALMPKWKGHMFILSSNVFICLEWALGPFLMASEAMALDSRRLTLCSPSLTYGTTARSPALTLDTNTVNTGTVGAPVFDRHQFFGTSEHYEKAHGRLLSGWMNYNYTACCWFPTSSNILILPSQFWQIRFESYWLQSWKCRILVLLRYNSKGAHSTVLQYTHNNAIAMARWYCMHSQRVRIDRQWGDKTLYLKAVKCSGEPKKWLP